MRVAFVDELIALAERDPSVWLLTGDLGFSVLERFRDRFGDRFLNVGVAEQLMIGAAAGLATCGKKVFVYSIANFPVMRALEQIRNDVCYHALDVTVVTVGAGVVYGSAGYTHHGLEDMAVMRALPGMTVVSPADAAETRWAMRAIGEQGGPAYLRLDKAGGPPVHTEAVRSAWGSALTLRPGSDVAILSCGAMVNVSLQVADELAGHQIEAQVLSVPVISPLDDEALRAAAGTGLLVVVEEHAPTGGLYSAVVEALGGNPVPTLRFGYDHPTDPTLGTCDYMRRNSGLDSATIVAAVRARLAADTQSAS